MFKNLMTKAVALKNRAAFKIEEKSPELYIAGAIVCGVAAIGSAVWAATHQQPILQKAKKRLDNVNECLESGETTKVAMDKESGKEEAWVVPYTKEDANKERLYIYGQTAWELAKLYAPSVAFEATSIIFVLKGHNKMVVRNASLTAAYATLSEGYSQYRDRVKEELGEEKERDIHDGVKRETVTLNHEDGSNTDELVDVVQPNGGPSGYARYFDKSTSMDYTNNRMANKAFLKAQQSYFNDRLYAYGYVYLNDVYKALGMEPTVAGQCVGWIRDVDNPTGDNYISFNIREVYRDAGDGRMEQVIMIDPNVDGVITGAIDSRGLMDHI